jgi:metal-responsive CopG/Arc/MetJ family transcriptional regulator
MAQGGTVSTYLPADWFERLDKLCERKDETRSKFIKQAIIFAIKMGEEMQGEEGM